MTSINASRLIEQAKQKKAEQVTKEVSQEVQQKQSSAGAASSSSVFEQEKAQKAGSNGQQVSSYDDWTESLNARGIKTTKLGANEANFANYAAALSDDLKNDILNSFDCEADYKLQAQIAGIFSGTNVVQSGDIISACKKLGIDVSVEYTKTSYIVDNKKGGQYANNKTNAINGSIAVYTFSDGNGGEIKIADANGNGALETEEIFMNEILSGVASDVEINFTDGLIGHGNSGAGGKGLSEMGIFDLKSATEDMLQKMRDRRISQEEFQAQRAKDMEEFEADLAEKKEQQKAALEENEANGGVKKEISQGEYSEQLNAEARKLGDVGFSNDESKELAEKKVKDKYTVAKAK